MQYGSVIGARSR